MPKVLIAPFWVTTRFEFGCQAMLLLILLCDFKKDGSFKKRGDSLMTDDGRPFIPTAALSLLFFLKKHRQKEIWAKSYLRKSTHIRDCLMDSCTFYQQSRFYVKRHDDVCKINYSSLPIPPLLFLGDFRSRVNRLDISRYQEIIPHDFL